MDRHSLNKMATREQLNKAIVLTAPPVWLAIAGAFLILAVLGVWAFEGELPYSTDVSGIYIDDEGLSDIYAGTDGIVSEILVDEGDQVEEGQLLAVLQNTEQEAQLADIGQRIKAVEEMTPESEKDTLTGDNKELAQLKKKAQDAGETGQAAAWREFDIQKEALLYELKNRQMTILDNEEKKNIYASCSGEVRDVWVSQGQLLTKGAEIASIARYDSGTSHVICYVPLSEAKKIKEGMRVQIYPSTVNKQECGHIMATVEQMGSYAATEVDMIRHLDSESLVQAFAALGPVVEMRCELESDPSTASGYRWSSAMGSKVTLEPGTLVTATIVTDRKRPIELLLPYLEQ